MLGAPLAAGAEVPFSSVMDKHRCRRIESTYPIVSPQQNRISPYRSTQGERLAARRIDSGAGMRSERKPKLLCNGADIGCVGYIDNIPERESGLNSLWCCTRESLINRLMGQSR